MPNSVLQIEDIVDYLKKEGNKASTEKINQYFLAKDFTKGQIAGVLYRGITNRILEKPCRAMYKIADTSAVDILKDKIKEVKDYIEELPYKYYQDMSNDEKQKFDYWANLINAIDLN